MDFLVRDLGLTRADVLAPEGTAFFAEDTFGGDLVLRNAAEATDRLDDFALGVADFDFVFRAFATGALLAAVFFAAGFFAALDFFAGFVLVVRLVTGASLEAAFRARAGIRRIERAPIGWRTGRSQEFPALVVDIVAEPDTGAHSEGSNFRHWGKHASRLASCCIGRPHLSGNPS